ncbi:MAG: phosphohistidine phosphatase SixA [Candidatus Methylomirabilis oxyfera]|nr:phosphohistidine phosphatase SixA [Candidatus Methylomirabilis oxyfera]
MAAEKAVLHYLVRHGGSKSEREDPAKPLSDHGREEVMRVAGYVASIGVEVAEIRHSDRLRARQTAEILAEYLLPRLGIREVDGLAPGADPDRVRAELEAAEEPLMLVGHLPHLGRLISALVLGNSETEIIRPDTATMICLVKTEGSFRLLWVLTPDLVQI